MTAESLAGRTPEQGSPTMSYVLLTAAALCALWGIVSAILLTRALDLRGMPTPVLFIGPHLPKNLVRYREITRRETGKVGPLFHGFLIPINLAWILAILAALVG
jgi:hypothetical protein